MTAVSIILCIVCQLFLVTGQILLKHALNSAAETPRPWSAVIRNFSLGVACLSTWFFLWLGLLGRWELSRLFPFEGLNPALLVIGAWLVLKERLPSSAWLGIVLISTGIALVSGA